ncbi:hypothetical protein PISMIDRAFT_18236 [Pisolithus microcarpus 441]|uniref:Reverse transcriptase n=1 Tax=Pisolithus microcarpus 441 TaxID=765257 RepID=A0A0C9YS19_9AGAM|nr:hypothetical protein PISMIDRAFT_18236 [Pisolithus microcarpus 441]
MCADSPTGSLYLVNRENVAIQTTIDSGAEINSIDPRIVEQYKLKTYPIEYPLGVTTYNGGEGFQIKKKVTLHAKIQDWVMRIKAYVLPLCRPSILLGMLWLKKFQPDIDWKTRKIRGWQCDGSPLPRAPRAEGAVRKTTISTELKVKASAGKEEVKLPEQYREFKEVFSEKDIPLPPHRPDEMKTLCEFIDENLKCGKIHYRHLNEHTVDDSYPLPNVQQLIDELCESRFYTKFDIRWGFTNIRVKDSDIWKGAFITPLGLFEPLVMFFGQKNSPPTFQRYMDVTFREQLMKRQQVGYMDNIVVHTKTREELRCRVREFLSICQREQLRLKISKCIFEAEEVEFLGYVIGDGRIKTHAVKTDAVQEWKEPENLTQLRSFLGFTNFYRKFIAGYSAISAPLHHLSKKDVSWTWGPEQQQAFDRLKAALGSSPVLSIPDPTKPFALFTDASQSATGVVLAQKGKDDEWHPCSYLSESLKGAEKNYPVYDLEFLAVIRALKAFRHYLISPVAPTVIFTDHKNLEYYKEPQKFTQQQTRWFSYVQGFPLKFSYTPGRLMMAPDVLSRRSDHTPPEPIVATLLPPSAWLEGGVNPSKPVTFPQKLSQTSNKPVSPPVEEPIKERKRGIYTLSAEVYKCAKSEMPKDSTISTENPEVTTHPDGTKHRKNRVYIPPGARKECLLTYHDHPSARHPGIKAMTRKMVKDVWWPGMWKYIHDYVKGCAVCQSAKVITHPVTPPVIPHDVPKNPFPFQQISMDLITDLPVSNTFDTVLTIVNQGLTKAAMFIPCWKDIDSLGIARLFHKHVYARFSLPESIISDRGPQFASAFTRELYKSLGVQSKLSTAYHPQTNGESERVNQELETYLRCYCTEHPNSWSSKLPDAEFAHNSRIHSIHQQTPYSLLYGYDPSPYPESPKVTPRRFGPFEIERVISPVAVRLRLPDMWHVHPVFHTGRLLPYHETPEYGIPDPPPPPKVVDDEVEWEVESILNHKNTGRGRQAHRTYLVKWKGFTHADNSWEPESSLKDHATELLDHYDAPLNTRPYALFDSSSDDLSPSPQLSIVLHPSHPSHAWETRQGKKAKRPSPLHQSVLFANGSRPGGVLSASAHSTHGSELEGPSASTTPDVPQIRVVPPYDPDHLYPPADGNLVPASPDYLNYVWTLAIFDRGYPFDRKTEEQNDRIRMLSEVYRGTDIALDRVPDLLAKTHICPIDSIADSIDRTLADLTINLSAVQYKLVLELASVISADECRSFRNREVDRYIQQAKERISASQDTSAAAGSTVGEKCPDVTVKVEEADPDPWSTEPIEFTADDRYSKKREASFSKTAKFLSETVPSAVSSFHWRSFLDAAAWNKADHSLHNAINTTTPIPPTTFHPVVYACYDCRHFGHWSCRNGHGSRWTPANNVSAEDENEGSCCSTTRSVHSSRRRSPTPGPSVNPGRSGVRRA